MRLNSCRTCKHLIVRPTLGGANYYCGHRDYQKDGPVAAWAFENKPNRRLPSTGARDCPGHESKEPT